MTRAANLTGVVDLIERRRVEVAADRQATEALRKRLGDIEWRLDNLYFIKNKFGRVVKFKRNRSQLALWKNRHFLNLILKDRQRGFSTFIAILILDTCLFSAQQECGIIDITLPDGKKKLAKIRFAYERLPGSIKEAIPLKTDAKETLEFANGSTIYVGTSHRGGTLQILHISEAGKISARNPERAREIRTGAMNTIAPGCWIFNESTAEGCGGEYYDDCQTAMELQRSGDKLTDLDYKFIFFGWWMGSYNEMDPEGVNITRDEHKYFDELEKTLEIEIGPRKRAWYVKKAAQQKGDMHREYPSTPEEAFRASIDGAYLARQMEGLEIAGQIGVVPYDPAVPVNTGWDFGLRDTMAMWLHQRVAMQHRIIGYIQGTDQDVLYYWRNLQQLPYIYGKHFLPHDGDTRRIGTAKHGTAPPRTIEEILNDAGMRNTEVVPRINEKYTAIQEVRQFLPKVFFDEKGCHCEKTNINGIDCLKNYKREWDDKLGTWKNKPRHDWAAHGYDAFETLVRGLGIYGDEVDGGKIVTHLPPPPDWRAV